MVAGPKFRAVMVTGVSDVVCPAAMVMVAGETMTRAGSLLERATVSADAGAEERATGGLGDNRAIRTGEHSISW